MNTLPPFYAFATHPECNFFTNHGTSVFEFIQNGIKFQAPTCDEAKKKAGIQTAVANPIPASRVIRHQRLPPTAVTKTTATPPAKLDATGTATIGASGAASAEGGASAPASGSAGFDIGGFNIPSLDDILKPAGDFFNSIGLPPEVFGVSTPLLVGGGAAILILLLWIKR